MNFKTTLALIALTAAATGASATTLGSAATYYSGSFDNSSSSSSYSYTSGDYDFSVASAGASVTTLTFDWNTVAYGGNFDLSNASISIYNSTGHLLASDTVSDTAPAGTTSSFNLAGGDYYFVIAGSVAAGDKAAWNVAASASPLTGPVINAPEPATTALLLAGVGVMAFVGRRRTQK